MNWRKNRATATETPGQPGLSAGQRSWGAGQSAPSHVLGSKIDGLPLPPRMVAFTDAAPWASRPGRLNVSRGPTPTRWDPATDAVRYCHRDVIHRSRPVIEGIKVGRE
jgi:hypothetical protein